MSSQPRPNTISCLSSLAKLPHYGRMVFARPRSRCSSAPWRCSFHAAGDRAERRSATGTAVPIISSRTRTRPASSSRSSVPTKLANGPVRIRTDCPVLKPAWKSVKLASSGCSIRASTAPSGTGIGRSWQLNSEETPTVLRTDNQRSRPRSRMMKRYRGNSGARTVLSWRAWRIVFRICGRCVLNPCAPRCNSALRSLLGCV